VKLKDHLAGYFKLNENDAQSELKGSDSMELERIYVDEKYQGMNIGRWILDQVKMKALEKKKAFLWLGVWEHNIAAIRFYERYGFTKFGKHPYYVGRDKQMDWLMRLDLVTLNS
jgi:ribosomal protein S18 acetylase RimI-like enzyme